MNGSNIPANATVVWTEFSSGEITESTRDIIVKSYIKVRLLICKDKENRN